MIGLLVPSERPEEYGTGSQRYELAAPDRPMARRRTHRLSKNPMVETPRRGGITR